MLSIQISLLDIGGRGHPLPLCLLFTNSTFLLHTSWYRRCAMRREHGDRENPAENLHLEVLIQGTLCLNKLLVILRNHQMVFKQFLFKPYFLRCFWWLGMTSKSHSASRLRMTGTENTVAEFTHHLLLSTQSNRSLSLYMGAPHHALEETEKVKSVPHQRNTLSEHTALITNYTDHESGWPSVRNFLSQENIHGKVFYIGQKLLFSSKEFSPYFPK